MAFSLVYNWVIIWVIINFKNIFYEGLIYIIIF